MHRGKVDPGVSELPRGNELSQDHVNRPLLNAANWSRQDNFCHVSFALIFNGLKIGKVF